MQVSNFNWVPHVMRVLPSKVVLIMSQVNQKCREIAHKILAERLNCGENVFRELQLQTDGGNNVLIQNLAGKAHKVDLPINGAQFIEMHAHMTHLRELILTDATIGGDTGIPLEQLKHFTSLTLQNCGFSFKDLEKLPLLKSLSVSTSHSSKLFPRDYPAIGNLTQLISLRLEDGKMPEKNARDLVSLAGMEKLTHLKASYALKLKDIGKCTSLETLKIYSNFDVPEIDISNLKNLKKIRINNSFSKILLTGISGAVNLESWDSSSEYLTDPGPFPSFKNLKKIEIMCGDDVKKIHIPNLPALEDLSISDIGLLRKVSFVSLPKVKKVSLTMFSKENQEVQWCALGKSVEDLSIILGSQLSLNGLETLENLRTLDIKHATERVTELPWKSFSKLEKLSLTHCNEESPDFLGKMPHLRELKLDSWKKLKKISWENFPNLETLSLAFGGIIYLAPKEPLKLSSLHLSNFRVDIPSWKNFPNLTDFKLDNCPGRIPNTWNNLEKLRSITLSGVHTGSSFYGIEKIETLRKIILEVFIDKRLFDWLEKAELGKKFPLDHLEIRKLGPRGWDNPADEWPKDLLQKLILETQTVVFRSFPFLK